MSSAFEGMAKQLQQLGPIGGGRWLYGWTKAQNAVELTLTRGGRTYLNLSLDDVADWDGSSSVRRNGATKRCAS